MNGNDTPTRPKHSTTGRTMSASLKERLKRCGRYHNSSPAPTKQSFPNPHSAVHSPLTCSSETKVSYNKSSSPESLHNRNPAKRKVDLCIDNHSSESVPECNTECTHESILPGKRKALENRSDFDCKNVETSSVKHNAALKKMGDPLTNCSQQDGHNDLHTINNSVSNTNRNCGQLKKDKNDVKNDSFVEAPPSDTKELAAKSGCISGEKGSLSSQLQCLDSVLKEKLELLRKLKMVKMYREKNNLTKLQQLIDRWRGVSQAALMDLHSLHPEPRPSMADLIAHLQIDPLLVQFDTEEQDFL